MMSTTSLYAPWLKVNTGKSAFNKSLIQCTFIISELNVLMAISALVCALAY